VDLDRTDALADLPVAVGGDAKLSPQRPTGVRYRVLGLTVAVYMITYIDRVAISTAAPSLESEFGFSLITMGWIFSVFQIGYALFQIPGGWLGDRFGPRRALAGIVIWWSLFTALTAGMWSAASMIICRFLFGVGEAGAFPIATRSLSRWMLPTERGLSQGLTHGGARLGGAVTPVIAVFVIARFGWRAAFLMSALLGLVWAVVWLVYYRDQPAEHPDVNDAERRLIGDALGAGTQAGKGVAIPWARLLGNSQIWTLSLMYFCYAYSIGIFLTWFPKYLSAARGFSLMEMGFYASLPLVFGVIGDFAGGWISDRLLARSGDARMARRLVAVIGFFLAAVTIPLAVLSHDPLVSVAWFCLAVLGLELTVGVSWAVTLDIGGDYAGSVSSVMNTFGNIGGATASAVTGYIVSAVGWNAAFFVLGALSLLGGLLYFGIDASRRLDAIGDR
jgi:sugar phosphate permease